MKRSFRTTLPQILAILAALVAAFAMREFLKDGGSQASSSRALKGPVVGEIQTIEGEVLIRPPRGIRFEQAKPGPYPAEAVIQTQAASAVVIEFHPGPTLRLMENSRLVAELDSSRDGALNATILAGEVTVVNVGSNPLFVLQHNGQVVPYRNGETPVSRTVPLIQVGPSTEAATQATGDLEEKLEIEKESELSTTPTVDLDSVTPSPTPVDVRPRSLPKKGEPEGLLSSTLTNDDIRSQVKSQAGSFQKCYVTMVNRMSEKNVGAGALPKGAILVSFKIQPTGKINEPRVINSPFKDETFERCIGEALGRMRFRQFQGAAIPVGEFPIVLE